MTVPPGGNNAGLSEAVAPTGVPCTPNAIGLDIAAPCIATEKLKVAALPAGTDWVVAPVAASVKSDAAPTVTFVVAEVLARKFESPAYTALKLCAPEPSALVLNAAPPVASETTDKTVDPSSTVTLPVGTPLVVLAAWIFSVTDAPAAGALVETESVVSVGAFAIVRLAGVTPTA